MTLTYINDTVYKHGYLVCIWYGLWMQYSESSTSTKAVQNMKVVILSEAAVLKDQIISTGLFDILGFFQKTNKQIHF